MQIYCTYAALPQLYYAEEKYFPITLEEGEQKCGGMPNAMHE